MSLRILQKWSLTRWLLWHVAAGRAWQTVGHFSDWLRPGEKILDIGAGICDIALILSRSRHQVTALDVTNLSCTPLIQPVLYDGRHMPFADKSFDTALLLTVLHHIPANQQETVLREAARVAKRIIIIEDVYGSHLQKYLTFGIDSLLNLEFVGHPHSNRTDQEWYELFAKVGLRPVAVGCMKPFAVLRQSMYILEPLPAARPIRRR